MRQCILYFQLHSVRFWQYLYSTIVKKKLHIFVFKSSFLKLKRTCNLLRTKLSQIEHQDDFISNEAVSFFRKKTPKYFSNFTTCPLSQVGVFLSVKGSNIFCTFCTLRKSIRFFLLLFLLLGKMLTPKKTLYVLFYKRGFGGREDSRALPKNKRGKKIISNSE